MLTLTPYDKGSMDAIERAIRDSDLGVNPTNDGTIIRVVFPQLTEERRKEFIKVARTRRRTPSRDPQRPAARQGRARPASEGRRGRRGRGRARREGAREGDPRARRAGRRAAQAQGSRAPRGLRAATRWHDDDDPRTSDGRPARRRRGGRRTPPRSSRCPMEPVPPPERRTRAGRNLPAAIGVGLGLGAVILLSLYRLEARLPRLWSRAAVVLAVWELVQRPARDRVRVPVVPLAVGASRSSSRPTPVAASRCSSRWR